MPDPSATIRAWTQRHREEILLLLENLIRLPSENRAPLGLEEACQLYVAQHLRDLDLEVDVFEPTAVDGLIEHEAFWPGRDYSDRPNVVGTWRGTAGGRSLLFSSHADVVPGLDGEFPPYEPRRRGERLYGRGSSDMKGGLAATIMAVKCLKDLDLRPGGTVIVESVVDEENGGANGTLASRLRGHNADAAICPEPTGLILSPAHRGGCYWEITVEGAPGVPFGSSDLVNPAYAVAHLATAIEEWAQRRNGRRTVPALYRQHPELPVVLSLVEAVSPVVAVPAHGRLRVWVEVHPGTSFEDLSADFLGALEAAAARVPVLGRCRREVRQITRFLPGSEAPADHPIIGAVRDAAGTMLGTPPEVRGAPFACDVFVFNLHSPTPGILMGPRGGNAHAPDEWVMIEDVVNLTAVFAQTIVDWCGVMPGTGRSQI